MIYTKNTSKKINSKEVMCYRGNFVSENSTFIGPFSGRTVKE